MTAFGAVLLLPLRHKPCRQQVSCIWYSFPFFSRFCWLIILLPDCSLSLLMCTCGILCFPSTFKFSTSSFFYMFICMCMNTHTRAAGWILRSQDNLGDQPSTSTFDWGKWSLLHLDLWRFQWCKIRTSHFCGQFSLNQLPRLLSSSFDSIMSLSRCSKVILYIKVLDLITSSKVSFYT